MVGRFPVSFRASALKLAMDVLLVCGEGSYKLDGLPKT